VNRRDFFRRSAVVAAGVVAADQIELLERLFHRRRFFPSADMQFVDGRTHHKTVIRTGLPTDTWRLLNEGVLPVRAPRVIQVVQI
jgi:hypothetical protein